MYPDQCNDLQDNAYKPFNFIQTGDYDFSYKTRSFVLSLLGIDDFFNLLY